MSAVAPLPDRGQVLLVDDEEEVLLSLRRLLRREFDIHMARSAIEGYAILKDTPIQVVISDQRMPDITGAEFFSQVKETYPHAIRLLLTGYADIDAVISAVNDGNIYRYITKPWNPDELPAIVRGAYEHYRTIVQNIQLVHELRLLNEDLEDRVQTRTADLRQAVERLSRSEQTLRAITDALAEGLVVVDREGSTTLANPEAERLLGWSEEALLGHPFHDAVHRHADKPRPICPILTAMSEPEILRSRDDTFVNRHGEAFPVRLSTAPLLQGQEQIGTVIAFQDVTDQKRLQAELERLATHDSLTGLYNRRELEKRLAIDLSRARRHHEPLALLMIDIDHFKEINDGFGHPVGDAMLCQLGDLFERALRTADYAARYGGEEFVVVLPQTPSDSANHLAERIRRLVAETDFEGPDDSLHHFTISIGLAAFPEHAGDADGLIALADQALYRAKGGGRNRTEGQPP
jgi:diguanylate cyclase (GGDEF)-like protein/PAS domain S-box-containing protein